MKIQHLLIVLFISVFAVSCDDEEKDQLKLNSYINEWVYVNMEAYYYWNKELPVFRKTNESPENYFESLINEEDRFSAFFDDYEALMNRLNGVSPSEVGFDYSLFRGSATDNSVVAVVNYTKANTHAQQLGIKRGDVINRINGTHLTMENYQQTLAAMSDATTSVKLGFASYSGSAYVDGQELTVNKSTNYVENPILLDTIFTVNSKKIAYLVYNFFTGDPGDQSQRYDLELNNIMGRFSTENINELVIDLRYNSGGMMSSAIRLGSMLVPGLSNDKVFSYTEYNDNLTEYFNSEDYKKKYSDNPFTEYFVTAMNVNTQTRPIHNISNHINRIYFLTGRSTASASEMVINGLKPYLPCYLIGETTTGKNVGSIVINDEDNSKNKSAFMPIVLKYFNKDRKSDFTFGFQPDFELRDDFDYQLGDTREALLARAIAEITGKQAIRIVSTSRALVLKEQLPSRKQSMLIVEPTQIKNQIIPKSK